MRAVAVQGQHYREIGASWARTVRGQCCCIVSIAAPLPHNLCACMRVMCLCDRVCALAQSNVRDLPERRGLVLTLGPFLWRRCGRPGPKRYRLRRVHQPYLHRHASVFQAVGICCHTALVLPAPWFSFRHAAAGHGAAASCCQRPRKPTSIGRCGRCQLKSQTWPPDTAQSPARCNGNAQG